MNVMMKGLVVPGSLGIRMEGGDFLSAGAAAAKGGRVIAG